MPHSREKRAVFDLRKSNRFHLILCLGRVRCKGVHRQTQCPIEEQHEVYPHQMHTGFHNDKVALGQGFEFIRRKQWTLYHWSNGEVISYNLSRHPNLNQVTDMLEKAFTKIPDNTNLILHSDQGWQYQHKHYQKMLKEKGIRQSMSRKGNCLDNACAENFFGLLKTELLYLQEFHSVEHFIQELHEYIEWYNNKRIKLKLNGLSPIDFRQEAA